MDFHPLAFHLEQTEALKHQMRKIGSIAQALAPQVQCTCDFMEQGQHLGCPAYLLSRIKEIADRYLTKPKTESL